MEKISQSAGCYRATNSLAYVVGIYLGDGSVWYNKHRNQYIFSLEVVDKDFAEKTRQELEAVIHRPINLHERHKACTRSGITYRLRVYDQNFCAFLKQSTNNKQLIPSFISKGINSLAKNLIEGLMDSEGCIYRYKEIQPRYKLPTYKIQVSMSSSIVDQLAEYLKAYGVSVYARRERPQKSGIPHIEYTLSIVDYAASGIRFNIARKQQQVEDYRKQLLTPSETEIFTRNRKDTVSPDNIG